ncbi:polysaccharide deacetylase family protein [Paenibacillus crassostreae]|uniref:Chitooligosaccharide deacetylase n=1 Tax=Paenibacillus crassostreae TaxID=1763538 RepID=A0A167DU09_9BACL|nr:polysaccharide deacetylase family protein [Paenibacillus crassostreae]AOZ91064.1 chitooligosaccharide deacetylase [Paenibacillus crassostreae]OAB74774.1 chitooligosaccharide deacetylase [Paenibacillus crassostreae]
MFRMAFLKTLLFLSIFSLLFTTITLEVQASPPSNMVKTEYNSESVIQSQDKSSKSNLQQNSSNKLKKKSKTTLSELHQKYPGTMVLKGPKNQRIALTFDDVPDPRFTPAILDILSKYHVPATFFIGGKRAKDYPELTRRIHREGHAIGNHSYDHPLFTKITLAQFQSQILTTEQIIYDTVGVRPSLIRPPYGEISEAQLKWAKQQGYKIVNWNVDSLDWKGIGKEEVKKNVLSHVGPGSIILFHAGGGIGSDLTGTIQALPVIIETLRNKGYTFVTVPMLIQTSETKK